MFTFHYIFFCLYFQGFNELVDIDITFVDRNGPKSFMIMFFSLKNPFLVQQNEEFWLESKIFIPDNT